MTVRGRSTTGRCEVVARQADKQLTNKRRCEPHGQINKRRRKDEEKTKKISSPHPSPKERECSNGKVRQTKNEQKTKKERRKNEERTKKERRKNEENLPLTPSKGGTIAT